VRSVSSSLLLRSALEPLDDPLVWLEYRMLALDATWRWALAQHRTPFSQPGHIRQRASRAAPAGNRSRSYAGHLHHGTASAVARASATRLSSVSLRQGSRPSRGSAALALPTRGFSAWRVGETARLVAHACAASVAVVKKVALPSGGANAHDVFAAGESSIGGARRGSSARVTSCLPCSMATLRTAAGFMERCATRGAARGAGRAVSADTCDNACHRVARRGTGHAGRGGAWGASRRDVPAREARRRCDV
jgi:hypothetical protein